MLEAPIVDVTSREFYGEGYDDSDKRIPDMTIIHRQLGKHSPVNHVLTTLFQTRGNFKMPAPLILSFYFYSFFSSLHLLRFVSTMLGGMGQIGYDSAQICGLNYKQHGIYITILWQFDFYIGVGWEPSTPLRTLLEVTLRYQHTTYARAMKDSMAKVHAKPQTSVRTSQTNHARAQKMLIQENESV